MGPSTDSHVEELLVRGYSGRIFLVVAVGTLIVNLGRQAIPPLLPAIIDGLSISAAAAGIALTGMRIAFALLQYPSGRLSDIVSRKGALVFGLIAIGLGFLVLAQVTAYVHLFTGTVLLGIGAAFFFVAGRVLLSDLFVERRGRAFGVNRLGVKP